MTHRTGTPRSQHKALTKELALAGPKPCTCFLGSKLAGELLQFGGGFPWRRAACCTLLSATLASARRCGPLSTVVPSTLKAQVLRGSVSLRPGEGYTGPFDELPLSMASPAMPLPLP